MAGILTVMAGLVLPLLAVIPRFWEVRTAGDFRRGEFEGVSVTGDGRLVLAPGFDEVYDTGETLVLSAASGPDGSVYLGTGHEGRVFTLDSNGNGRLLADLGELDVLALAVDTDGALFAATSPDGGVYRIAPDGSAATFFDPDDLYIWSMAFDEDGRLLVATGDEGIIYRVDGDGNGEVFYDSDETHIMTLAPAAGGAVIAGGDPKGYIYRIAADGSPFVLYDSDMREVHQVALGPDGTVYAAVVDGAGPASGSTPQSSGVNPPLRVDASSVIVANAASPVAAVQQSPAADLPDSTPGPGNPSNIGSSGGGRSTILEITPDGSVTTLWTSGSELVHSILPTAEGLLFSTGTQGRVYAYEGPGRAALLAESGEEQTTVLVDTGERVLAMTANVGKVFELSDDPVDTGTYTSIVRDAGAVSSWGRAELTGRGVTLRTRSGNTASPDRTWSDWQEVAGDGAIQSPRARFIQWQARLDAGDADPELSAVLVPYLQQNFRPEVESVDVLRPGVALRESQGATGVANGPNNNNRGGITGRVEPTGQSQSPRSVLEAGVQALRWTSRDANDDVLTHSILYRAGTETEWKVLASGIAESYYTIAANALPDGVYVMRIVASDIASNPTAEALEGEFETRPFAIDSAPPAVDVTLSGVEGVRVRVRAAAVDGTSILKQAAYSVDAGPWTPIYPEDGIVDSTTEDFEFLTTPVGAGEHVISVRIYDQSDNVGIGSVVARLP